MLRHNQILQQTSSIMSNTQTNKFTASLPGIYLQSAVLVPLSIQNHPCKKLKLDSVAMLSFLVILTLLHRASSCDNWIWNGALDKYEGPFPIGICNYQNHDYHSQAATNSWGFECEADPTNSSLKIVTRYNYDNGDCTGDKEAGSTYPCNDRIGDQCECTIGGDSSDPSSDCDIYTST